MYEFTWFFVAKIRKSRDRCIVWFRSRVSHAGASKRVNESNVTRMDTHTHTHTLQFEKGLNEKHELETVAKFKEAARFEDLMVTECSESLLGRSAV
jgi:hypothetical protein